VIDNYGLTLGKDFQVQLEWLAKEAIKDVGDVAKHRSWLEHAFNH